MPNKKREAVWFLINGRIKYRKFINRIGFLFLFVLISGCSSQNEYRQAAEPYYRELSLFRRAGGLLDDGQYAQARDLYSQFLEKYPKHPYSDDAAYRIAYIHVIADSANPYYSYPQARILFQNFIDSYQNSHYITACKNWLMLLDSYLESKPGQVYDLSGRKFNPDEQLMREIETLKAENDKLKQDLEQLQQALER